MNRCLCSHVQAQHFAHSGVCWGTGCGCVEYVRDSDAPVPESSVSSGAAAFPYNGFYQGKYTLGETA